MLSTACESNVKFFNLSPPDFLHKKALLVSKPKATFFIFLNCSASLKTFWFLIKPLSFAHLLIYFFNWSDLVFQNLSIMVVPILVAITSCSTLFITDPSNTSETFGSRPSTLAIFCKFFASSNSFLVKLSVILLAIPLALPFLSKAISAAKLTPTPTAVPPSSLAPKSCAPSVITPPPNPVTAIGTAKPVGARIALGKANSIPVFIYSPAFVWGS